MSERRVPRSAKAAIQKAALRLLQTEARPDWNALRNEPEHAPYFGDQTGTKGKRMFYRLLQLVLEAQNADKTRPREMVEVGREALAHAVRDSRALASDHLPPPPPAYLRRAGKRGMEKIQLSAAMSDLWHDMEQLREHSVADDHIVDPKGFARSITARLSAISDFVRLQKEIYDMEAQQELYSEIVSIITGELADYPEVQHAIVARLADLNSRYGFTIHAEPMI